MKIETRLIVGFRVDGLPRPQGSKQAFIVGKGSPKQRAVMVESAKGLPEWKKDVAQGALQAMLDPKRDDMGPVNEGPIRVVAKFEFPRLKSHYKSDGETLRDDAPFYKSSTPDTDKLQRAVGDAMSKIVYGDDRQIAWWDAVRMYGSLPGVSLFVYAL